MGVFCILDCKIRFLCTSVEYQGAQRCFFFLQLGTQKSCEHTVENLRMNSSCIRRSYILAALLSERFVDMTMDTF